MGVMMMILLIHTYVACVKSAEKSCYMTQDLLQVLIDYENLMCMAQLCSISHETVSLKH